MEGRGRGRGREGEGEEVEGEGVCVCLQTGEVPFHSLPLWWKAVLEQYSAFNLRRV